MIPKIIHQTGPDPEKWHPIWKECQESWKNNFPDFEYKFWTDEDIRQLVQENYSEFLDLYDSFTHHICRVDFARFCILHSYGGIYVDLDIYCYKNFYDLMRKDLYILESWSEWGEKVQNSLMISSKDNEFWLKCMMFSQFNSNILNENILGKREYILNLCGPKLLSDVLDSSVKFLPKELFNPQVKNQFNWGNDDQSKYQNAINDFNHQKEDEKNIITRHYLTGNWG
jgi:mannosyltransferase OCH1-like enzyme